MEVNRLNFESLFPEVEKSILEANFIAIDTEFTGLNSTSFTTGPSILDFLDSTQERYDRLRNGATAEFNYLIVQYGICTFHWDESEQKYLAKPFNFEIFPDGIKGCSYNPRFACQALALKFLLREANFNFTEMVEKGIPFLRKDHEEAALKEKLVLPEDEEDLPVIKEHDRQFVEQQMKKVRSWMETNPTVGDTFQLEPCSSYRRRILYQEFRNNFPEVHVESISVPNKPGSKAVVASIISAEKKQQLQNLKIEQLRVPEFLWKILTLSEISCMVGFRRVFDLMVKAKKPIIGHNMFSDMIYSYLHFYQELPPTVDQFKLDLHQLFPYIIDTKYLSSMSPSLATFIQSRVLGHLYKVTQTEPFVSPTIEYAENFSKYHTSKSVHEAGYDAYMAGYSYIKMAHYLGSIQTEKVIPVFPSNEILSNLVNRLPLIRTEATCNLIGPDHNPNRYNAFYVYNINSNTKNSDIVKFFTSYGDGHPVVKWIDDKTCVVCIAKMFKHVKVHEVVQASPFNTMTYEEFAKKKMAGEEQKTVVVKEEVKIPVVEVPMYPVWSHLGVAVVAIAGTVFVMNFIKK